VQELFGQLNITCEPEDELLEAVGQGVLNHRIMQAVNIYSFDNCNINQG